MLHSLFSVLDTPAVRPPPYNLTAPEVVVYYVSSSILIFDFHFTFYGEEETLMVALILWWNVSSVSYSWPICDNTDDFHPIFTIQRIFPWMYNGTFFHPLVF